MFNSIPLYMDKGRGWGRDPYYEGSHDISTAGLSQAAQNIGNERTLLAPIKMGVGLDK